MIRRSVRGVCGKQPLSWPGSSLRDRQWSHQEQPVLHNSSLGAAICVSLLCFDSEAGWHEDRWFCFYLLCFPYAPQHIHVSGKLLKVSITHGTDLSGWVLYTSPSDYEVLWEEAGNLYLYTSPHQPHVFKYKNHQRQDLVYLPSLGHISLFLYPHMFQSTLSYETLLFLTEIIF